MDVETQALGRPGSRFERIGETGTASMADNPGLGAGLLVVVAVLLAGIAAWTLWPPGPKLPAQPPITSQPILTPPQERLLSLLAGYQRQYAADKLIVGRKDGRLCFDDDPNKGKEVSLLHDLYGSEINQATFERLVESMPTDYVRLLPEMRWGSPFVISVTEAGLRYLKR
jgi:hypothetical protein